MAHTAGHEGLREGIVTGTALKKDDVLLTIGAAGALFIIATSLLEKGDELIVVRPNYATNIETPRAIGADIRFIDLRFEEKFALDIDKIKAAISPGTRYISVTYPHNPTGVCLTDGELRQLVDLAEEKRLRICWSTKPTGIWYSENSSRWRRRYRRHVISVSSLSKTYGLPGLRVGWIICRDRAAHDRPSWRRRNRSISAARVLDEEIAFRYWQQKDRSSPAHPGGYPAEIRIGKSVDAATKRFRMGRARRRLCLLSPASSAGRRGYRSLLSISCWKNMGPMSDRAIGSRCRGIICGLGLAGHRRNRCWKGLDRPYAGVAARR